MLEKSLSQIAIDWARTSTSGELKAKLVKTLYDELNATRIALFSLNNTQDHLICEQTYPRVNFTDELSIALDDSSRLADDPLIWTLRSGKDLHLKGDASFTHFSLAHLYTIWSSTKPLQYIHLLCMSQTATYPNIVVAILNDSPIDEAKLTQQKDVIRLAEGLLANIFARSISEKNLQLALHQNQRQQKRLDEIIDNHDLAGRFIYQSSEMQNIHENIKKVADTQMTVCFLGETGVGKDVAASELHRISSRSSHPFIAINCAAIPANLLESELFGYVKGAHSHAYHDHEGVFAQVGSGTLFLDEIGELSQDLQVRLLRVLQNKTIRPLGADRDYRINCRIVVATNQNLEKKAKDGTFRADLYYRISQIIIQIPPLRKRQKDIEPLTHYFIREVNRNEGLFVRGITADGMKWLKKKIFKGNIRELRHLVERSCLDVEKGEYLDIKHFQNNNSVLAKQEEITEDLFESSTYKEALETFEKKLITQRLQQYKYCKSKAAKSLQMASRTFYDRCKKLDLLNMEKKS